MSKVEMLIYVGLAVFVLAALPLEGVAVYVIGGIGFAGAVLGIVLWNLLETGDNDD